MTFSITYTTVIEAESVTNQDNLLVGGTVDNFASDFASKLTFSLTANQETNVEIPGLNAILSLLLVADNLVNLSLLEDVNGLAIYDGTETRQLSKFFGNNGIGYDHIKIKAGSLNAKVTIVIIGKSTINP